MGRKAGLHRDDVVDAAQAIADDGGLENLTLTAVADRLGVRTPSLYNHVDGLAGLKRELAIRGSALIGETIAEINEHHHGEEAVREVCRRFRRLVHAHPGLYAATIGVESLMDDDEVWGVLEPSIVGLQGVMSDAGIPDARLISAVRALRSTLHGFVTLEQSGGFGLPESFDTSFERTIDVVVGGLRDLRDDR